MPHLATIALAAALSSPISVDYSGNYVVQGSCAYPVNASYRGTLRIQLDADRSFYTLTWHIGEDSFSGSALYLLGRFVVEFRGPTGRTGLMTMAQDETDPIWRGLWATHGTAALCNESWQFQPGA